MTDSAAPAPSAGEVVTIRGATTATFGRFLVSANRNHFVSDAKPASGGPGEAIQAGELLLSALASCGLAVVQAHAGTLGVTLPSADVAVSFERDPADITRYQHIRLRFRLTGVDQAMAEALVKQFTDTCPIYNTLRRGGTVVVEVNATTGA